jgi:hypothetical protein
MHAVFMVSGVRRFVDEFFDWLDCRFYGMPFKNPNYLPEGKDIKGDIVKEGERIITARVRYGVYGTYELCFPEEHKDVVLTTLRFHQKDVARSDEFKGQVKNFLANMEIGTFRKLIGCKPIPEFKTDRAFGLPEDVMHNIRIIPVGVRYDEKDWLAPSGLIHERI